MNAARSTLLCIPMLFLLMLFFSVPICAWTLPFGAEIQIDTNRNPTDTTYLVDVDKDGDLDLLASGNSAIWFENLNTNGTRWATNVINYSYGLIRPADIDKDGNTDYVRANPINGNIDWFRNVAGDGSLWTSNAIGFLDNHGVPHVVDIDGDGSLDVLGTSLMRTTIVWYANTAGDGSSWTEHTMHYYYHDVEPADIDRDGDMDFFAAWQGGTGVVWFSNDAGDGSSWSMHAVNSNSLYVSDTSPGDVNGDGAVDLICSRYTDDEIFWYENTASNGVAWLEHRVIWYDGNVIRNPWLVRSTDLDGDGDLDIVAAGSAFGLTNQLTCFENLSGDGLAWTSTVIATDFDYPDCLCLADVNQDGYTDIQLSSVYDEKKVWYPNRMIHRSAIFPTSHTITSMLNLPQACAVADLNRDGHMDVVSGTRDLSKNNVVRFDNQNGDGTAWDVMVLATNMDSITSLSIADMDNDGILDVVAGGSAEDEVSWFEKVPMVGWVQHVISTNVDGVIDVETVDMDHDGDVDVVSAAPDSDTISWHENNSGGISWSDHTIYTGASDVRDVDVADVNRDGKWDVVYAAFGKDEVGWCRQEFGGGWSQLTISTNCDGASSVAVGEVELNGDPDIMATAYYADKLMFFENGGAGFSWNEQLVVTNIDGAREVEMADFDLDGDQDAICAVQRDDTVLYLENVSREMDMSCLTNVVTTVANGVYNICPADMDGDGDMDILSVERDDNTLKWYENKGGHFALATLDQAPSELDQGHTSVVLRITAMNCGKNNDTPVKITSFELQLQDATGAPLLGEYASNILAAIHIYHDGNGDGVFGPMENYITSWSDYPADGSAFIANFSANALWNVYPNTNRYYFLVCEFHDGARYERPHAFRLAHYTEASSTGEDAGTAKPLLLEYATNIISKTVTAMDPDSDDDGMPDAWETLYSGAGLSPSVSNSPTADYDGDGCPDVYEYLAGTDPEVASDYLRFVAITNEGMCVLVYSQYSFAIV